MPSQPSLLSQLVFIKCQLNHLCCSYFWSDYRKYHLGQFIRIHQTPLRPSLLHPLVFIKHHLDHLCWISWFSSNIASITSASATPSLSNHHWQKGEQLVSAFTLLFWLPQYPALLQFLRHHPGQHKGNKPQGPADQAQMPPQLFLPSHCHGMVINIYVHIIIFTSSKCLSPFLLHHSVQFSSGQSLDQWDHQENKRDNSAEILFQSSLQEALVISSGMGRDDHSLIFFIQHFLCWPWHRPPSRCSKGWFRWGRHGMWYGQIMKVFVSWQLPEEVPMDPQGSWSCIAPSSWSCAPGRRCREVSSCTWFQNTESFFQSQQAGIIR